MSDRYVRLTVQEKCVKFCDPRLNRSGEIRPEAVGCGIFCRSQNFKDCQPEVTGDPISDFALDQVGDGVRANIIDSKLNSSRTNGLCGRADPFYALLCRMCRI